MMLAEAAEQIEAARADLDRIGSAFGHAAAPLRAPATPAAHSEIEEITEQLMAAAPYAIGSPTAPPPSPVQIKAEPLDAEEIDWRRHSFLNGLFGGSPPPEVKEEPTTPPTSAPIKQEPVTPQGEEEGNSMDAAFLEMDKAINQPAPIRTGPTCFSFWAPARLAPLLPPVAAPFAQNIPTSSTPRVYFVFTSYN